MKRRFVEVDTTNETAVSSTQAPSFIPKPTRIDLRALSVIGNMLPIVIDLSMRPEFSVVSQFDFQVCGPVR
jgi:hypothetical protein